ncbi:MAG: nucleoside triphosphate pyrophosphohydrolase [Desulfobacterales bacterium]|nr:nucleoside triphosphate pyrophosphohydrolase [Desulfobacterales bacterium]
MEAFDRLVKIMETLRAPGGCPWDAEQTHQSLVKNLIEEAYELAEAIDKDDPEAVMEELGDVLLQVVFHSTLAKEAERFEVTDVINYLCDKLVYRHPHVFGDTQVSGARDVIRNWDRLKRKENGKQKRESILSGVPERLPALLYALKIQSTASRVGFDWEHPAQVREKIDEELAELSAAMDGESSRDMAEEIGDILFSVVNLARKLDIDPEAALRRSNRKFAHRFYAIEKTAAQAGKRLSEMPMDEKEAIWQAAKTDDAD